jgi:hypothetical protein
MSGCRIGRVKLKGGAELYRLPTKARDEAQRNLVDRAARLAGYYEEGEIGGYVVFAWGKNGRSSIGYFVDQDGVVGLRMLPSFVADALRERMIEEGDWGR